MGRRFEFKLVETHNFRYHLYWHRALFHLEMEEFDTVLDLYDQQVSRDLEMDQYLDVCNSASLLWRLEMFGVDVGARWRPVADIALRHIEDRELMFVQLHHHMALLSAGEDDAAARLADHVRQHAGRQYDQAEAAAKAAVPLVTAMTALRAGDYDAVVEAMWPARYDLALIGGSHAQRDLFEEMLAWSAIRSRHHDLARNLLAERVAVKPHSAWGWKIYAAALNRAGDSLAAHRASDQAQRLSPTITKSVRSIRCAVEVLEKAATVRLARSGGQIEAGVKRHIRRVAVADLEIDGVALAAIDQMVAERLAALEAGDHAGGEFLLTVVGDQHQCAGDDVNELILLGVIMAQGRFRARRQGGHVDAKGGQAEDIAKSPFLALRRAGGEFRRIAGADAGRDGGWVDGG